MDWQMNEERLSDLARFFKLVDIGERHECWEWLGNTPGGRHGHFSIKAKSVKAHRWIYELCVGPIPDGIVIRHKCDNPKCVNPLHLTAGTPKDNTADMFERGRAPDRRGEKHPLAKIDADAVRAIRAHSAMGMTQKALAEQFGISNQHIGKIVRRENWRHI